LAAAGARAAVNYSSDRKGTERFAQVVIDNRGRGDRGRSGCVQSHRCHAAIQRSGFHIRQTGRSGQQRRPIPLRRFHGDDRGEFSSPLQHQRSRVDSHRAGGDQAVSAPTGECHQSKLDRGVESRGWTLLYASAKGAIETLTRGLAIGLAPRKIRVNAIAPGHTETEGNIAAGAFERAAGAALAGKTPLGRLGRVTDIAPSGGFPGIRRISLDQRRGHSCCGRPRCGHLILAQTN